MNTANIYGFTAGFLSVAFITAIYLDNPSNLLSGIEKFSWLLFVVAMFIGTWRERQLRPDLFLAFHEALKTAYKIFVIAYLIKFVTIYLLFNFYDTSLQELAREIAVKIFTEHRNEEMPQEIFEQQLKAFSNGYFGPKIFDIGVMLEMIVGFIAALLIAFLFKREKPEF